MNPEITNDETVETPESTGIDTTTMPTDVPAESTGETSSETASTASASPGMTELVARIESAVESLEASGMDPEQRAALADSKRLEALTKERDSWKQQALRFKALHQESTVRRLLTEAAQEAGAYKPQQIVDLLSSKVHWSKDGASPILTLSLTEGESATYPSERFVEGVRAYLAENPNLARSQAGGGAGSSSEPGYPAVDTPRTLAELRLMRPLLEEKARLVR